MPAEESSAARGRDRSRATTAISRALHPPLLAAGGAPLPGGLALRVRSASGSRRPPVGRSRTAGGPRTPAAAVCGGSTSRHAGPGTAR